VLFGWSVWFQWSWSGTLDRQEWLKVGRKTFGGEMVFVQIVFAFAKPSIAKFKSSPYHTLFRLLFTHALYLFLNTIIDMDLGRIMIRHAQLVVRNHAMRTSPRWH
jgi:hypothetical protein